MPATNPSLGPSLPSLDPSREGDQRPICLIGMMGSGKTTVGRRLAARLGRRFVDADKELESRCGVTIATIFELEGEAGFREREACLIGKLSDEAGIVLATGGGAVLREGNRQRLRERCFVIYLQATVPELWHRLRHDKVRPLLRTANPRQRIAELLHQRDPLYEACAHLAVLTGRQPADRLATEIIERLPDALRTPDAHQPFPDTPAPSGHGVPDDR